MARIQARPTDRPKLILEVLAYLVLTSVVIPFAAFMANLHLFRTTSEQLVQGFFFYWIVPIGFGVFLLIRAVRGLRLHRVARIFVIMLALMSILWPIGFKVFQVAMEPVIHEQRIREEEARQQKNDELNKGIERNEDLRRLAARHGCGERPGFDSQDYSYRINFYREKITELKGEYADFISTLNELKHGYWEECAEGHITPEQLQDKYASISDFIVDVYRRSYGEGKFQEFESAFKAEQAKRPNEKIY